MVNPVAVYQSQSVCAIEIPNDVTKHARLVLYNLLVASNAIRAELQKACW